MYIAPLHYLTNFWIIWFSDKGWQLLNATANIVKIEAFEQAYNLIISEMTLFWLYLLVIASQKAQGQKTTVFNFKYLRVNLRILIKTSNRVQNSDQHFTQPAKFCKTSFCALMLLQKFAQKLVFLQASVRKSKITNQKWCTKELKIG